MSNKTQTAEDQLAELAAHLAARRDDILLAWHEATQGDPELKTPSALSRTQFNDHIPDVLDAFQNRLCARQREAKVDASAEQKEKAAEHGFNRWHHGYNQREVMREWGHLHVVLVDELEQYAAAHPELEPTVMPSARRALARLCGDGVVESATRYAQLHQVEAGGRVRDLEHALQEVRELNNRRSQFWREAAHDLRGNLGVVSNATAVLTYQGVSESVRTEFVTMLQKGVDSLHALLNDLTGLARLEAGHERPKIESFDVAALIGDLCGSMEHLAEERGLFLKTAGPDTLTIEGDPVKIRRIVQNLLQNALKYTERGGVKVSWGDLQTDDGEKWALSVQDTGPGFVLGATTPMALALRDATKEARAVDEKAAEAGEPSSPAPSKPGLKSQSDHRPAYEGTGEGIGLSIVKRLCELLGARLELETQRGQGSTLRVVFPRHYDNP